MSTQPMKALSIRQPWAWLILNAGNDVENRTWPTKVRGRVLIHAAKGMTQAEYVDACYYARMDCDVRFETLVNRLDFGKLQRGGIIGSIDIVDCVKSKHSNWHIDGQWGFVLNNPTPLPFTPFKGALGFFDVPNDILQSTP